MLMVGYGGVAGAGVASGAWVENQAQLDIVSTTAGDHTYTFSVDGFSLVEDDMMLIVVANDVFLYGTSGTVLLSGVKDGQSYTQLLSAGDLDNQSPAIGLWYKRMGSTPDTSVLITRSSGTPRQLACGFLQVQNVDWDAGPFSGAYAIAGDSTTNVLPNAPSQNASSAKPLRIIVGGNDDCGTYSSITAPSGFTNHVNIVTSSGASTSAGLLIAAQYEAATGALDPAIWGGTVSESTAWRAIHLSILGMAG